MASKLCRLSSSTPSVSLPTSRPENSSLWTGRVPPFGDLVLGIADDGGQPIIAQIRTDVHRCSDHAHFLG
jgi:hypothetical protein